MAKENKSEQTKTRKCHTAICEPGSTKGTMLFFGPSPLPFGGSTVLETYSSTKTRSRSWLYMHGPQRSFPLGRCTNFHTFCWWKIFFPSNAFMASARSFTMFWCMLQIGINWLIKSCVGRLWWNGLKSKLVEDRYIVLCTVTFHHQIAKRNKATKTPKTTRQKNRNTNTHKTKTKQTKNNKHNRAVMWQVPVYGWQG